MCVAGPHVSTGDALDATGLVLGKVRVSGSSAETDRCHLQALTALDRNRGAVTVLVDSSARRRAE
jgi:hypothetical protein